MDVSAVLQAEAPYRSLVVKLWKLAEHYDVKGNHVAAEELRALLEREASS